MKMFWKYITGYRGLLTSPSASSGKENALLTFDLGVG